MASRAKYLFILSLGLLAQACQTTTPTDSKVQYEGDSVFLTDRTGEKWNITDAVEKYEMIPENFHYGLGRNAFVPINNPEPLSSPPNGGDPFVFGASFNGIDRAYSRQSLLQHETVNDLFQGKPVLVVYCVLADLAGLYERTIDGQDLTLVASGWTYHNGSHDTFVLYDRETGTLWFPFSKDNFFVGIHGPLRDRKLMELAPVKRVSFSTWKSEHPNSGYVE